MWSGPQKVSKSLLLHTNLPHSYMNKKQLINDLESAIGVSDIVDDIIKVVADNTSPEDVFDIDTLSVWAENNGYVPKD